MAHLSFGASAPSLNESYETPLLSVTDRTPLLLNGSPVQRPRFSWANMRVGHLGGVTLFLLVVIAAAGEQVRGYTLALLLLHLCARVLLLHC